MKAHLFLITTNNEFIGPKEITLAYNGVDRFTNTDDFSLEIRYSCASRQALLVTPGKAYRVDVNHGTNYFKAGDLAVFHKGSIVYYP